MADDGFQLNFEVGDVAAKATPKFRGGPWRERSRLSHLAKHGRQPERNGDGRDQAFRRAIGSKSREDGSPVKKRKIEQPNHEKITYQRQRQPRPAHLKDAVWNAPPGQREIISSLFTSNPAPQSEETTKETEQESEEHRKPSNAPLPDGIDTFTSLGLVPAIAAHLLTKMDYKTPTEIQRSAVSQLTKEDADVFIQSQTGSGKTLAYLLPIVQRLVTIAERWKHEHGDGLPDQFGRESGLFAIILAPTRELCKQILLVLERLLGCAHFIVAGTVSGGERKKSEKARFRKGVNMLVATPGRLVDHLDNTEALDVSKVRYVVLDEGDRLMDEGFEHDISKILRILDGKKRAHTGIPGLPERRITVLCSATIKSTVEKLGELSLKDAVLVSGENGTDVTQHESTGTFLAPAQLKQTYIVCATKLRLVTLVALLKKTFARKGSVMKAIVFLSCADSVDFHHKILTSHPSDDRNDQQLATDEGPTTTDPLLVEVLASSTLLSSETNTLDVYKIHGSLAQQTRSAVIKSFAKSTQASLLLATDVASRGLDLPNLDLVIEYDPAFAKDDHLHRIGRTARVGRDGRAVIFLMPGNEEGYVQILKESYKQDLETQTSNNVTGTSADLVLKKGFTAKSGLLGSKSTGDDHETLATEFQLDVERAVLADAKLKEMAKKAFQSHIRAYATHVSDERKYFDIKQLHLGHLAKAFGLRDPPGKVNVQGLRNGPKHDRKPEASNVGRKRTTSSQSSAIVNKMPDVPDLDDVGDAEAAAEKMRAMVRNQKKMQGAGADEFNIG